MADGIDNLQICPVWPDSCSLGAAPLRPDPAYGMGAAGSAEMPLFPPITNIVVPPAPVICCIGFEGKTGDSFECYPVGPAGVLELSCGWSGQWNGRINYYGLQALQTWGSVNWGWSGAPNTEDGQVNSLGMQAMYSLDDPEYGWSGTEDIAVNV
jgi:hypothetical protein